MKHPNTRVVVIVIGGQGDPAEDMDAEVLVELVKKRTLLTGHIVKDKGLVNRIVNHLIGIPGF